MRIDKASFSFRLGIAFCFKNKKWGNPTLTARSDFEKAVTELGAAVSSNDLEKIKIAVETMHSHYVTLATVLE